MSRSGSRERNPAGAGHRPGGLAAVVATVVARGIPRRWSRATAVAWQLGFWIARRTGEPRTTREHSASCTTRPDGRRDHVYDDQLRRTLAANLGRLERVSVPLDGRRHAAVAVVVVDSDAVRHAEDPAPASAERMRLIPGAPTAELNATTPRLDGSTPKLNAATTKLNAATPKLNGSVAGTAGGPAVLLTRRAERLQAHAGQWALPGGRVETGEEPVAAARRELLEELGLDLDESDLLGVLDDYATRSGYVITPFVFWGGADPHLDPDPYEVRSVHRVSLRELCRPDSPRFVSIPESDRPVVQIPIGGDLIHAPTGAVLLQFRRVAIEGVLERVADYEQPVFAWR